MLRTPARLRWGSTYSCEQVVFVFIRSKNEHLTTKLLQRVGVLLPPGHGYTYDHATKTQPKQDKFFLSFFIVFNRLSVV